MPLPQGLAGGANIVHGALKLQPGKDSAEDKQ